MSAEGKNSHIGRGYVERIEELAEKAHADLARMVRHARTRLHLPPYYLTEGRTLRMPQSFKCPECGGPIAVEVSEWCTESGLPTAGGLLVHCEQEMNEWMEAMAQDRDIDRDLEHRMWQSDWQGIVNRAERFCARNVRVSVHGS